MSRAVLAYALALSETIREVGEVPAGVLYAPLCDRLTADQFNAVIQSLVNAGLVRRDTSHLLRWIGPTIQSSRKDLT